MAKLFFPLASWLGASYALPQWPPNPPVSQPTQTLWGQCGGVTYEGPTLCPNNAYCYNDGNIWYSQCIPIETTQNQPPATVRTITTIFSVGGPTPTVVSTRITYYQPPTPTTLPVVTVTLVPDEPCNVGYLC